MLPPREMTLRDKNEREKNIHAARDVTGYHAAASRRRAHRMNYVGRVEHTFAFSCSSHTLLHTLLLLLAIAREGRVIRRLI